MIDIESVEVLLTEALNLLERVSNVFTRDYVEKIKMFFETNDLTALRNLSAELHRKDNTRHVPTEPDYACSLWAIEDITYAIYCIGVYIKNEYTPDKLINLFRAKYYLDFAIRDLANAKSYTRKLLAQY